MYRLDKFRHLAKFVSGHANDPPIGQHGRAHRFVKLDRWRIPIEHTPFEATAVALDRNLCEMNEQRFAVTLAATLGLHEQVLEIKTFATEKRRKVMKKEREADRHFAFSSDDAFDARVHTEKLALEIHFRAHHQVLELFVHSKRANKFDDGGEVVAGGGFNRETHVHIVEAQPVGDGLTSLRVKASAVEPAPTASHRRASHRKFATTHSVQLRTSLAAFRLRETRDQTARDRDRKTLCRVSHVRAARRHR
jgi:hypothetical protein